METVEFLHGWNNEPPRWRTQAPKISPPTLGKLAYCYFRPVIYLLRVPNGALFVSLDPVKLCESCGGSINHEGHRETCDFYADTHCPRCGDEWVWDGDTEASRVCGSCRADEAEARLG